MISLKNQSVSSKQNEENNETGITLIALIITIIILAILAAVSIRAVTNMEIVGYAVNGTQDYVQRAVEENKMTGDAVSIIEDSLTKVRAIQGIPDVWDGITRTKPKIDSNRNWHIYTCAEMKFFADFVNGTLTEEEYSEAINDGLEIVENETIVYLESNLDLGAKWDSTGNLLSGTAWTPVGIGTTAQTIFLGIFEGNNHYIQGVYVNQERNHTGLFGISNTIKNLTIKDSHIEGISATGGIVGTLMSNNTLENCNNSNTTVIQKEGEYSNIGGIAGQNLGIITKCTNSGKVIGNGALNNGTTAGGIVGITVGAISDCINEGDVSGIKDRIGGITAEAQPGSTITKCINNGTITSISGGFAGGIVAYMGCTIDECINTAQIIAESGDAIGGIAGAIGPNSTGIITNCYNIGDVKGNGSGTAGILGILNSSGASGVFRNNYNIGNITGNSNAGGIVGTTSSNISASNNYALTNSAPNISNSEKKEASEMKTDEFVTLLNTVTVDEETTTQDVWKKDTSNKNNGYPILKWQ